MTGFIKYLLPHSTVHLLRANNSSPLKKEFWVNFRYHSCCHLDWTQWPFRTISWQVFKRKVLLSTLRRGSHSSPVEKNYVGGEYSDKSHLTGSSKNANHTCQCHVWISKVQCLPQEPHLLSCSCLFSAPMHTPSSTVLLSAFPVSPTHSFQTSS